MVIADPWLTENNTAIMTSNFRGALSVVIPSPTHIHHFFPHYRIGCPSNCPSCMRSRRPACRELDHCPHECNRCTSNYSESNTNLQTRLNSSQRENMELRAIVRDLEFRLSLAEYNNREHISTIHHLRSAPSFETLNKQLQSSEVHLLRTQLLQINNTKEEQMSDVMRLVFCEECQEENGRILEKWGAVPDRDSGERPRKRRRVADRSSLATVEGTQRVEEIE